MASKSAKTLRKVVEGEHLAANALAVAIGKVKETDLQQLLSQIQDTHATNVEEAGTQLKNAGGKYPIPGLHEQLKKGWEGVASAKDSKSAVKLLQKKEREALVSYKDLLKKVGDEQTMQILLRNMADTTQNIVQLSEKLSQMQQKKKKGLRILGLPLFVWITAAGGGGYYYWQQRNKGNAPTSPSPSVPSASSQTESNTNS